MKIGLRILLGYFVIVALAALLVARVFVQEVKPGVRQAMEDTLADTANVLAELASDDLLAGNINDGRFAQRVRALRGRDIGAEIWGFEKRSASYRITITDAKGIVVFDSEDRDLGRDNSRWNDVYRTLRGQYGARSTRSDPGDEASTVMHVAAPITDAGRIVGVLTVSKPNRVIEPFIQRSQAVVMRWGLVLMGVALLVGLAAAWWLSRQLGGLRNYATAVARGERAALPDAAGEFGDLGRALDTMRRELEGREYVEQYVQTLTHEMKSPLAAIRGAAELLQEPLPEADRARFAANVQSQGERLTEMIDKLLALASVEHRTQLQQSESINMSMLIAGLVEEIAPRLAQAGVTVEQRLTPDLHIEGDRFLLRQAIRNLLDNAIEFSANGTGIDIELQKDDGMVELAINDHGPGVPTFAGDRVFERFYSLPRPDGGSRSSGLGLPFVREVAALHGGSIRLEERAGGGTQAILRLPA